MNDDNNDNSEKYYKFRFVVKGGYLWERKGRHWRNVLYVGDPVKETVCISIEYDNVDDWDKKNQRMTRKTIARTIRDCDGRILKHEHV